MKFTLWTRREAGNRWLPVITTGSVTNALIMLRASARWGSVKVTNSDGALVASITSAGEWP